MSPKTGARAGAGTGASRRGGSWAERRYRLLLPAAARGALRGRAYAAAVAAVELARDRERRRAATSNLRLCLGLASGRALGTFARALRSEAAEEAETARLMVSGGPLPPRVGRRPLEEELAGDGRPTIFATLHLGSPVLAYLALCRDRPRPLWIVGRPLDATNPMPEAKAEWARRKVAWVERMAGRPFLATDPAAIARARERLVAGDALFTPFDVPGDVAARSARLRLLGHPTRLAAGMERLARLTGAAIRPIVGLRRAGGLELVFGRRIEPSEGDPLQAVMEELSSIVRRHPGEWWMWPYLRFGDGAGEASGRG